MATIRVSDTAKNYVKSLVDNSRFKNPVIRMTAERGG